MVHGAVKLAHPPGFEPRSDEFGARDVADYTRNAG